MAIVSRIVHVIAKPGTRSNGNVPVKGVVRHPRRHAQVTGRNVRVVGPKTTSLLEQRGWTKRGSSWRGSYVTPVGTWSGRIEKRGDIFLPFIYKPPRAVMNHRKFICFHKRSRGWFWIHLQNQPDYGEDPSGIILCVERILTQALKTGS